MSQNILERVSAVALDLRTNASMLVPESITDLPRLFIQDTKLTSIAVVVAVTVWTAVSYLRNRHAAPGPRRLPLLGNVLQMPLQMPWVQFTKWSQQYGASLLVSKTILFCLQNHCYTNRSYFLARFARPTCCSFKHEQSCRRSLWQALSLLYIDVNLTG
jgi:hypothetical protein